MAHFLWRQWAKRALSVIVFLIGTEVVYKCVRYCCAHLRSGDKGADETVYYRVLFFPDEGILASMACERRLADAREVPAGGDSSSGPPQNIRLGVTPPEDDETPRGNEEEESTPNERSSSLAYDPLPESTSLIHMVNVLDAAEKSLLICVYLISSSDLIRAIVRAKARGVRVRVILDKSMSQLSNLSALLKNSVPVRYSKPSQMMHNKFAVADAPENSNRSPYASSAGEKAKDDSPSKDEESPYTVPQKNRRQRRQGSPPSPEPNRAVLMTGSFNWTWSGVISNYENVVVTNDPRLVWVYAEEFERLWGLFSFAETVN